MLELALLLTALLFGGMVLFSFGFAALMFQVFDATEARRAIRGAFPSYYLFVIATAAIGVVPAYLATGLGVVTLALAVVCLTTIYARQVLMHRINDATDAGMASRFKLLHGASVVLQLGQIGLIGWALVTLV